MELEIDRLSLALRLSGDPQRADPVARRLRDLAAGRLPDALARVVLQGPGTGDQDGEIVFVERLEVHCGANTAWDDAEIAAHIARRLALALQSRLADPGLLRFRDRAEFVAAALVALAEGRAGQAWWLREFDGLLALSTSAALRTLVINEAADGITALARLTDGARAAVLGALGEGDAMRLLSWFGLRTAAPLAPLAVLWPASAGLRPAAAASTAAWLQALVAAEQALPGSAGAATLSALRSLAALRAAGLFPEAAALQARVAWRELLARHRLAADWLDLVGDHELAEITRELAAGAPAAEAPWCHCEHGGLFLLLGRAQRLGWLARWQSLGMDDALCRALAVRAAGLALAGPGAARVWSDPALRTVCGLDGREGPDGLVDAHAGLAVSALRAVLRGRAAPQLVDGPSRALHRLLQEAAAMLLAGCARALPGLAGSSPAFLRAQALSLPARLQAGRDGADGIACLGRAPLDVLLVLSGLKRARIELPGVPAIRCVEDVGA